MQKKNENKKNKKVVVVAAMALLLALVGISGGETYAKYASNKKASATATVAKWGYVLSVNNTNLFGESYSDHTNNLCTPLLDDTGVNVNASSAGNIVAPGTTGSFTIAVNGEAEVLSKITTKVTNGGAIKLTTDGSNTVDYEPVRWTIAGTAKINDLDVGGITGSDLTLTEMLNKLDTLDGEVSANKEVSINLTISWKWAFSTSPANDVYDTMLGDLIALDSTKLANKYTNVPVGTTSMSFGFDIVVEQIQKPVQP